MQFYSAIGEHRFSDAASLWSPSLRQAMAPSQYINDRFAPTQSMSVDRIQVLGVDPAAGTATVAVSLTETDSGNVVRHIHGTWQLVQQNGSWYLNWPNLSFE